MHYNRMDASTRPATLSPCTCFCVRKLARRVSRLYDQELAECGLRVTQYSLLATLAAGEATSLSALADRMEMDRTTLTRNLRPLLAQDLVALEGDARDARRRAARITDTGRARLREARAAWKRAQRATEALLGTQGVDTLHAVVDDALARLRPADAARARTHATHDRQDEESTA